MRWSWMSLSIVALLGCAEPAKPGGPEVTSHSAVQVVPLPAALAVDVLLVIDNSPAMAAHHARVQAAGAALASVLTTLSGGVPDLHLGVITTDLGTSGGPAGTSPGPAFGQLGQGGCGGVGDDARLLTSGAPVTGAFLADTRLPNGTRARNYTGELGAAIARMVDVRTGGCAFARPLEAIDRALGHQAANAGFLRDAAMLYVVVISAQDDCSFGEPGFLAGATAADTTRCQTAAGGLTSTSAFVERVKQLKTDSARVVLTGLFGPGTGTTDGGCTAAPAPRLHAMLGGFPNRSLEAALCGGDPASPFELLGLQLKVTLGVPCWESALDLDPVAPGLQLECTGELQSGGDAYDLPLCGPDSTTPCFTIEPHQACEFTPEHLSTKLHHIDAFRGFGVARLECLVADPAP